MHEPYDRGRIARAVQLAGRLKIRCHTGVYAAVSGPCYETRAEYRYLQVIGADAVGMSTVPEVIAARHMDLPCFAVSVITDLGGQETVREVTHEEVVRVAAAAGSDLTRLIRELIAKP
jgi:purine-nucleoside phosphorylase